jgi:hypothetical protein
VSNPLVAIRRRRGVFLGLLLLCLVVFAAGVMLQRRALAQQQTQADSRARVIASEVGAQLHGNRLSKPLDAATTARLLAHATHVPVIAERVWTPTGTLRFSSLSKDRSPPVMDLLKPSTKGTGHAASSYDGNVVTTYMPLRTGLGAPAYGAVEVQQSYAAMVTAAATPWSTVRTGATALGFLLLLALVLGSIAGLPGRRATKAGAGFVRGGNGPEPRPELQFVREDPAKVKAQADQAKAEKAQADRVQADQAKADRAQAEADKRAAQEELVKVKEQFRSDHDRAGARIEELSSELERVNAKLQEAQVAAIAAAAAPVVDPTVVEHVHELEQSLAEERHRSTAAEARTTEMQAELDQTESRLRSSYSEIETLGAELSDRRANVERLDAELGAALERAREAEDMAAAFQDRLRTPEPDGNENPLDVWAARQPESVESGADDDAAAGDLRSRLTRAAARKHGRNQGEAEWP